MDDRTSDGVAASIDERGIARIVLDRPDDANTMTLRASTALAAAIDGVADAAPRVVLLTGRACSAPGATSANSRATRTRSTR